MFKKFKIVPAVSKRLADTVTPVGMYLRLRSRFPKSLLLESADYRGTENSFSYICCDPIAGVKADAASVEITLPDGTCTTHSLGAPSELIPLLQTFIDTFEVDSAKNDEFKNAGVINGLFGYFTYEAVQFFEDIQLKQKAASGEDIPRLNYSIYRYIIAINHFKDELYLLINSVADSKQKVLSHEELYQLASQGEVPQTLPFRASPTETSNFDDAEHIEMIEKCKKHIFRGDVFQIVPSRKFSRSFEGDDFSLYRTLRSVNPSPYLFYYDMGDFHIFGSSPEAQIAIKDRKAAIFPIAGTYRRSGDPAQDAKLVDQLHKDPKENAEHVMLVDLARNDLSKHCNSVHVESFSEAQLYSHVIHLTSKVVGSLFNDKSTLSVVADTFPAGTLSGAPKYKAMELIDLYERGARTFYGGALGFIGFNGDCVHAIIIRSFLSKNGKLFMQAGGGVVADSVPECEVQEIRNKLGALNQALKLAEAV